MSCACHDSGVTSAGLVTIDDEGCSPALSGGVLLSSA